MTVPRTAAEVLAEHVTLEVECIDRMFLNVYQPMLQHVNGVVGFFRGHRGHPFASSALMDPISKDFVAAIHRFCRDQGVELVEFAKGQRKDDLALDHLAHFQGSEGVLFVGRAQEKTRVFRTEKRRNPETGSSYPWIVTGTGVVNHFYFYCVDEDFGPFFLKFCSYFPYTAKLCLNGHEYAKRQATKAGIGFTALDNGFATCDDPDALQAICDRLDATAIDALLRKWLAILPHPFTAEDRRAGYRYEVSILQAEFSLTQMLDRPLSGRVLFEELIRENLDLGRPDRISLVFDRRIITKGRFATPGRFAHPGTHQRGHTEPARGIQAHQDQAVPQRRARAAHRDNHQRQPRLRHRQTAVQPARPAGGRLPRHPTAPSRPTSQQRPHHRPRRLRRDIHTRGGRQPARLRPALRPLPAPKHSWPHWSSSGSCPTGSATATCAITSPHCWASTQPS